MKNFQDLDVYKRSSKLFPEIYRIIRSWKIYDQRELGGQIVRAANSIHANIAEGYSKTPNDFKRYLGMALGSCDELVSHLADAHNVSLLSEEKYKLLVDGYIVVGKQLTKLKKIGNNLVSSVQSPVSRVANELVTPWYIPRSGP